MSGSKTDKAIMKTTAKAVVGAVCMFAFVFVVMVPLYETFCEVFGLNGKYTGGRYEVVKSEVDSSRTVKVVFVANHTQDMPWEFGPKNTVLYVHPGEVVNTAYLARNTTERDMVAQAVPSFVPSRAAQYFHKTECFCFRQQPLAAGESAELWLQFIVDQDLPADIREISLSYSIFDVTDMVQARPVAVR
jgi:cytochrome c oxidase assembly protein subunit 11